MTGATGFHAGHVAEEIVARDYLGRDHLIEARRWRCSAGEIDLVMRRDEMLVFVEVKKSRSFARAVKSLSAAQIARICSAAEFYLAQTPRGALTPVRFDLATVDQYGAVDVIENAFAEA